MIRWKTYKLSFEHERLLKCDMDLLLLKEYLEELEIGYKWEGTLEEVEGLIND